MAATAGTSTVLPTEKMDTNVKSYKEVVGASNDNETSPKQETVKEIKQKQQEPESAKTRNTSKNGQEKNEQQEKGPVKLFDSKLYVEAPPPKVNPWKKSTETAPQDPVPPQKVTAPKDKKGNGIFCFNISESYFFKIKTRV